MPICDINPPWREKTDGTVRMPNDPFGWERYPSAPTVYGLVAKHSCKGKRACVYAGAVGVV